MKRHIVVLGANSKPERYANRAVRMLLQRDYRVTPVHPVEKIIEGLPVVSSLDEVTEPVDTLTVYVSLEASMSVAEAILHLRPGRVIFNPGAENPVLMKRLEQEGIRVEEACTLVLLSTGGF